MATGGQRRSRRSVSTLAAFLDETYRQGAKIHSGVRRGSIEFLYPANHRILAYVRQLEKESILVVNNLSSTARRWNSICASFKGNILIEMFGRNIFPRVGDLPYLLTLGPTSSTGSVCAD